MSEPCDNCPHELRDHDRLGRCSACGCISKYLRALNRLHGPAAPAPTRIGVIDHGKDPAHRPAAPTEPVTPTEGEREQARALIKGPYQLQIYFAGQRDPEPTDYGVEHIARALARTRAEAMEEAARIAENHGHGIVDAKLCSCRVCFTVASIAAAIRNHATKGEGE